MFLRKMRLTLAGPGREPTPVPRAWLDQFFMRDFTGYGAFDETLPAGDGELEASLRVSPEDVKTQFEKWLRGRKMIPPETVLVVAPPEP
jgi:hypothetical protein